MASVYPVKKKGSRSSRRANPFRVSFKSPQTGKSVTIQVGKLSATAEAKWKLNLNRLESTAGAGEAPAKEAIAWIRSIAEKHRKKLAHHGLYKISEVPKTFAALCAYAIQKGIKEGNKKGTVSNKTNALVLAVKYFEDIEVRNLDLDLWAAKSTRHVSTITEDDVRDFRNSWLTEFRRTENSRTGVMKSLIHVLNVAKDEGYVETNVATELKGKFGAAENLEYVGLDEYERLAKHLDSEWNVILGLAMFAGLRAPSEVNMLRWQDINWNSKQMYVRSPKLGKDGVEYEARNVPIFDELIYPLASLWTEQGEPTEGFVVSKHRTTRVESLDQWSSYAMPVQREAAKHSVTVWSRPLQNLRASFVSRRVAGIGCKPTPMPVLCKWAGHSELVANTHYIVLTDENLEGASTWSMESVMEKVMQEVKQHGSAGGGNSEPRLPSKSGFSSLCQSVPTVARMPDSPARGTR